MLLVNNEYRKIYHGRARKAVLQHIPGVFRCYYLLNILDIYQIKNVL